MQVGDHLAETRCDALVVAPGEQPLACVCPSLGFGAPLPVLVG